MRPIGPTSSGWSSAARHAAAVARVAEKASLARDLGTGQGGDTPPWRPASSQAPEKTVQETEAFHVPFRHEVRLKPAFVAQLLGQVLPDPERRLVTPTYEHEGRRMALLCDRRL